MESEDELGEEKEQKWCLVISSLFWKWVIILKLEVDVVDGTLLQVQLES